MLSQVLCWVLRRYKWTWQSPHPQGCIKTTERHLAHSHMSEVPWQGSGGGSSGHVTWRGGVAKLHPGAGRHTMLNRTHLLWRDFWWGMWGPVPSFSNLCRSDTLVHSHSLFLTVFAVLLSELREVGRATYHGLPVQVLQPFFITQHHCCWISSSGSHTEHNLEHCPVLLTADPASPHVTLRGHQRQLH